jgi:hypothetical protein
MPVQRPPDIAQPTTAPVHDERYLQWTLPVDLLAMIPLTYWMVRPRDVYLAMPSLVLPPLIHVAHDNARSAAISFVMRAAMVGAVYYAGRSAERECANDEFICVPLGQIMLGELAIMTPIMIDSFLLAKRTRADDGWSRLPLIPSVGPTPGGGVSLTLSTSY